MVIDVQRRMKGRQKRRQRDSISDDLREKGSSGEEAQDQAAWRRLVTIVDPI